MKPIKTKLTRHFSASRLILGGLFAAGIALAASSASADNWKHGYHDNGRGHSRAYYNQRPSVVYVQPRRVYVQPRPVIIAPRPVVVAPAPVYVAPEPVYVEPQPIYAAPSVNVVIPLHF
ncbi:MAG: hypothetical protein E6Q98_00635 [Rhodospirillaceae bacterium]|nr:MAG: hypothetical protein E6Q98_00635 [Rhodospirillaceae bacterium]